ncbi:HGxxPAAW family protein [Demequina sp.]|uniref:HGxxPAAW family protein n=1 Tax=Demequina sp. TaxID=2050685 RepID=UPI003D13CAA5
MSSVHLEPQDLPDAAAPNHGMTLAAWVLNSGIVIAFLVGGIGMMVGAMWAIWVGIAIAVLSLAAGATLRALGHGQPLR